MSISEPVSPEILNVGPAKARKVFPIVDNLPHLKAIDKSRYRSPLFEQISVILMAKVNKFDKIVYTDPVSFILCVPPLSP